jgi:hypothetical protein
MKFRHAARRGLNYQTYTDTNCRSRRSCTWERIPHYSYQRSLSNQCQRHWSIHIAQEHLPNSCLGYEFHWFSPKRVQRYKR